MKRHGNFSRTSRRSTIFKNLELLAFDAGTSDAEFLFGDDVVAYLAEIRRRALSMRTIQRKFGELEPGEARSKLVDEYGQETLWLGDQLANMKKPFLPYMGFSNIK